MKNCRCQKGGFMSSTDERRRKYDYRAEYLKHNKGFLFGHLYFCAMCGKPITKENMEVDHIVPLNKQGINHVVNCIATCRECNRRKSDKLDNRCVRQVFWKVFEEVLIGIRFLLSTTFKYCRIAILYPITNAKDSKQRAVVIIIYAVVIGLILLHYGGNYAIRSF